MLSLFLLFPFAFILFSFITHICFSLLENNLRRTVAPNVCRQAVSNFLFYFLSYRFRVIYYYQLIPFDKVHSEWELPASLFLVTSTSAKSASASFQGKP
jgi:hypothetical protein